MKSINLKRNLLLASASLVLGCTSSPDIVMSERYDNVIYEKPGVDLSDYRTVMFGALEINFPEGAGQPDAADLRRLRKEFGDAMYRALQESRTGLQNRYVDRPGRDVLLVKPRLSGTRTVSVDSSTLKSDSATDSLQVDGSLTLEISLHKSFDGELLLRAEEIQSRSRRTESASVDWMEVSDIADTWAKGVVDFLDEHLSK